MKKKHKEHVLFVGALASILALGYIAYEVKRSKSNATKITSGDTAAATALTTPIPVFAFDNIGGSYAPKGQTVGHNIGTNQPHSIHPRPQLVYFDSAASGNYEYNPGLQAA